MPASSHTLDRIDVTFDDDRAIADPGPILTGTLLRKLELERVADEMVGVGYPAGPQAGHPDAHAGGRGRLHR